MRERMANPFHAEECPKSGHSSRFFMAGFVLPLGDSMANPFHAEECPKSGHSSRFFMAGSVLPLGSSMEVSVCLGNGFFERRFPAQI